VRRFYLLFIVVILVHSASSSAAFEQDSLKSHSNSSVFKDYQPSSMQLVQPSYLEYQLWEELSLVRKANQGDPVAEEELGTRYFFGKGFPIDTGLAAYWIGKAAGHNITIAQYNYGIFLNNGWGVDWNPFEAFKQFKVAAMKNLPEAEFALGIEYTDNLVVQRNLSEAYRWIKLAADAGYEPAKELIPDLVSRIGTDLADSLSDSTNGVKREQRKLSVTASVPAAEPILLDFGPDTVSKVSDLTLLNEAYREGSRKFKKALGISEIFGKTGTDTTGSSGNDSAAINVIMQAANVGSPEALTVLGRCYELGIGVPHDRVLAAEQYLRASRLDSRHALELLLNIIRGESSKTSHGSGYTDFFHELESRTKEGDYDAAFVWAGLVELGLDQRIDNAQAFDLLLSAASHNNVPSLIEVGRCYYTGQWTKRDPTIGEKYWRRAADNGSLEAKARLAATVVISDTNATRTPSADIISTLINAADDGSIVAQMALAYCFEKGIGVAKSTSEAVRLYRNCAMRGSLNAYNALKRMYDKLRPKDKEFIVDTDANE
jgi:TPR repeat protein